MTILVARDDGFGLLCKETLPACPGVVTGDTVVSWHTGCGMEARAAGGAMESSPGRSQGKTMKIRWTDWLAAVAVVLALGSFAAADGTDELPVVVSAR